MGFDLGFERAGMTCVAQVENNAHANQILNKHWPSVERFEDVKHVGRSNLPNVDVLCGGFPCQDVSVAGKRAGLAGERSGLWFEFLRITQELTPRLVVIENVPGLLSSNSGEDFKVILQGLVECGYRVTWRVLDAQYFGVAQRRRRVFIVGSLGDGRSAEILFERESLQRGIETRGTERQSPSTFVIKGAAIGRQPQNGPQRGDYRADGLSFTLNASEVHAVGYGETGRGWWRDGIQTLRQRDYKDVANVVIGTLNAGASDAVSADFGVRRLTPLECERLQGFPDGWTECLSDSARYARLGNAVCVNVSFWLGQRMEQA